MNVKKIGIIGGVSWLSTIEYYRTICELSHRDQEGVDALGPPSIPEMVVESLNINKSFNMRGIGDNPESWMQFEEYFRSALIRLETSGAEVAFIASNTPHNRFREITKEIGIPVISIFEATANRCLELDIKEALILGTAPTMESAAFSTVLSSKGINSSAPEREEDRLLIVKLISELQMGKEVSDNSAFQSVINNTENQFSGERIGVCLSCTELSLLFPEYLDDPYFEVGGVLYLNTIIIHAIAVYEFASEPTKAR